MTTSTAYSTDTRDRDRLRRLVAPTAVACAVIASGFTAVGVFYQGPKHDHDHSVWEFYSVTAVILLATAVVFGYLLPRALRKETAAGTALALSVIALLLLLPAFWSGLPLVLGAGGVLLGYAGRHAPSGAVRTTAAVVCGLLATLGYVAIYALDTIDRAGLL